MIRTGVRVEGIVQGVGFRPFVYSLATRLGLGGFVGNDGDGVFVEVEGAPAAVGEFLRLLERDAPPLARIERVTTAPMIPTAPEAFEIVTSEPAVLRRALVSADTATCDDCLRELADPADRRYGFPFINCTNCGPRFTIVRDVPYDRALTTMADFAMCGQCAAEYHDPDDRRFHAQPTCCPACGPRLRLTDATGSELPGDPITAAADMLRSDHVLAVKGLGGYHLAADATSERAVAALRQRKHREDKPFAVLVADLAAAQRWCEVGDAAARLLSSAARPIVLLPRLPDGGAAPPPLCQTAVRHALSRPNPHLAESGDWGDSAEPRLPDGGANPAPSTAPGNRQLGLMLPYTPLHHLLVRAVARPLVLTSGNVSDEPIAYRDDDALARLGGIADAFLAHDRAIHIRTDDSVARVARVDHVDHGDHGDHGDRARPVLLRRSRGYVPEPLTTPVPFPRPVLACGAELKNTFCLAKERHAFVSQHIGDLENAETLRSFTEGIEHLKRLFDIEPRVVAHDLHPEYLSTKYAVELENVQLTGVQHHHAHIAACLADNGAAGPVIGVAFDGTGYGTDGTIWGGEFLVADLAGFERGGHLAPLPMPGGAAAIRQPWRMAAVYLDAAFAGAPPDGLEVTGRNSGRWQAVVTMARNGVNSPLTSSAGRLFDAVAALLNVRDAINYEGQAAVELEQWADIAEAGFYKATIHNDTAFRVDAPDLVRAAVEDLRAGVRRDVIAARFHNGVAAAVEAGCLLLRERTGLGTVALSGGVFQNTLLLRETVRRLEARDFTVLSHSRVPCNDGGISLGQAVVAAARDSADPGQRIAD
ncbi:MAG: carbamoyltransferase HypF [Trebonia sp.]